MNTARHKSLTFATCERRVLVAAFSLRCLAVILLAVEATAQQVDVSQRSGSGPAASADISAGDESTGYRPTGAGGLPLARNPFAFVVSVNAGYDDNGSSRQEGSSGSAFARASVAVTYSFVGPRFQGTLATDAAFDYYFGDTDNTYRPNAHLDATLGYTVNQRLTLNGSAGIRYHSEPDISLFASPDRASGDFWYYRASIAASYVWLPRFSTVTSYSMSVVDYVDDDATIVRSSQFVNTIGQQGRFLFLPETVITGDYIVTFTADSLSQSVLAGVDHLIGPRLRGSLRAGVQFNSTELFGGLIEINRTSPHVDGTVSYTAGSNTTVALNSSYSIESSNLAGSADPTTFRTGLSVTHGLTPRINGTASGYYRFDDYEDSGFSGSPPDQQAFDASLGLSYAVHPRISASFNYQRTDLSNSVEAGSYSRNRYLFGMQVTF